MCDSVRELIGSAGRLRLRPREGRDGDQIGHELKTMRHLINLLELEFATTAAEFAADDGYEVSANSAQEWIRHECHMSTTAANMAVEVGQRMGHLVASTQAVLEGRIGYGHLAL